MPRATNAPARRQRRKKVLKQTKGYWGRRKNAFRVAKLQLERSWQYAYRDRRNRKREFRRLWILRINAAARMYGLTYGRLMHALHKANIRLNRKVLADLAVRYPEVFRQVVERARAVVAAAATTATAEGASPQETQ